MDMNVTIQMDGDAYMVALPPSSLVRQLLEYLKQHTCLRNNSWDKPFFVSKKSEAGESEYFIYSFGNPEYIERKILLDPTTASYDFSPLEGIKLLRTKTIGFRPLLIPLDKENHFQLFSEKENPFGSVVSGGRLQIDETIYERDHLPKEVHLFQSENTFRLADSLVGGENLCWFIVRGMLLCANILFYSNAEILHEKQLLSTKGNDLLFFQEVGIWN